MAFYKVGQQTPPKQSVPSLKAVAEPDIEQANPGKATSAPGLWPEVADAVPASPIMKFVLIEDEAGPRTIAGECCGMPPRSHILWRQADHE